MRKYRYWLLGGIISLLLGGIVWAQTVTTLALSGNEAILFQTGGPGGTGGFTTVYALRNATGYATAITGTTVNTTILPTTAKLIALGAITTWNITLPTAPYDGQMVEIACPGGTATSVNISPTVPTGVGVLGTAFTSCTSGGAAANTVEYIYSASANNWYRIQ